MGQPAAAWSRVAPGLPAAPCAPAAATFHLSPGISTKTFPSPEALHGGASLMALPPCCTLFTLNVFISIERLSPSPAGPRGTAQQRADKTTMAPSHRIS